MRAIFRQAHGRVGGTFQKPATAPVHRVCMRKRVGFNESFLMQRSHSVLKPRVDTLCFTDKSLVLPCCILGRCRVALRRRGSILKNKKTVENLETETDLHKKDQKEGENIKVEEEKPAYSAKKEESDEEENDGFKKDLLK